MTGRSRVESAGAARICPSPDAAAVRLAEGELVAFPTETVWGLAAAAKREDAVSRLFEWKGRSPRTAVAVLVVDRAEAEAFGGQFSEAAADLAAAHWPGPLTLVLHCRHPLAYGVAAADGTVGFRCSSHPTAAALARAASSAGIGPITATSLNRSGEPPARTRAEAVALCAGHSAALQGGPVVESPWVLTAGPDAGGATASTVVRAVANSMTMLRQGEIRP